MIRVLFIAGVTLSFALVASAQPSNPPSNFSGFVEQQWLLGKKKKVLQLAENRLQKNLIDLASLLVTLDYSVEFMDLARMRVVIPKIKAVSTTISSPNFERQKNLLSGSLEIFEQLLPTVTPEMAQAEAHKGLIKNKPLSSLVFIQALEADGLVLPITRQERTLFEGKE